MYNDILTLVGSEETVNDYGEIETVNTETEVFCKVKSIGQSEFYQAAATGLKPELKFVIADYYDYNNQKRIKYNNTEYQVIKTYRNGNELEITVSGGVENVST